MYKYQEVPSSEQKASDYPEFVRGTTPEFAYTLTDSNGDAVDLSQFSTIKVTLAQAGDPYSHQRLTLENHDILVSGNVISFSLTESQSLLFNDGYLSIQIYGKSDLKSSWSTLAEDITVKIRKSLKDGDRIDEVPSASASSTFQVENKTVTGTLTVDHVSYANGTKNYEELKNKPALVYGDQRKELIGNVSMADFGLREESVQSITNTDIDDMIRSLFPWLKTRTNT